MKKRCLEKGIYERRINAHRERGMSGGGKKSRQGQEEWGTNKCKEEYTQEKKEYSEVKRNKRTERGMREGKSGTHKGGKVKLYIICNVGYFPSIKFS